MEFSFFGPPFAMGSLAQFSFHVFWPPWRLMPSTSRSYSPVTMSCKQIIRLGSAFLAGAFVFWENHDLKKPVVFGSANSSGVRVGVPSRGFFFLREEYAQEKSYAPRVGVPSRGSCFARKTACPGKSYVSLVGVPSRGFCFLRKHAQEKAMSLGVSGRRS